MSTVKLGLNLSNFSPGAQAIFEKSREAANEHRAVKIDTGDLLAATADSETLSGEVLRGHKVTYGEVLSCRTYHIGEGKANYPFNESDFESNFEREARVALFKTVKNTEEKKGPASTESDLLHTLLGYGHDDFTSYRIIKRLERIPVVILNELKRREEPSDPQAQERPREKFLSKS